MPACLVPAQQAGVLQRGGLLVSVHVGDMRSERRIHEDWQQELAGKQVLVCTPAVLLNLLAHAFVKVW